MEAPELFGNWFRPLSSWFSWRVALAAAFGLPIERTGDPVAALKLYQECTARSVWPTKQATTMCFITGVRSGKSRCASLITAYLATLRDYSKYLAPGERGVIPVVAVDRKQARVVFNYTSAFLTESPVLNGLLENEPLKEAIMLKNGVNVEVMTASLRSLRGSTNVGAVLDECAYYRTDEAADADHEIYQSVKRGMLTIPNAMLVMISSPYGKRGLLWDTYKEHWGQDGSATLVWKAPTYVMNRTVTRESLQSEFDRDPEKANADYNAEFRSDVARFIPLEIIEANVDVGRVEFPPAPDRFYMAFADPSGGSSDSFGCAIGHREDENIVIDAVREWESPFSPDSVVSELAHFVKPYGITEVIGDRYAGQWPVESFSKYNLVYTQSAMPKSDLYRDMLPLLNAHRVRLPDVPRIRKQLWELERRTTRSGRDTIDHPIGSKDDLANVCAGVCSLLANAGHVGLTW